MSLFRKIIDSSTWVIFFASVIFSLMTVVAQNSIPGDSLFMFKLGYEKVMLASSRFLNKQVDVQIEFVARRFDETTRVLASQYGSESLNRLNTEVESTAYTITMIEDPAEKKVAAKKYIAQLNVISTGLGQQKQNFISNNSKASAASQNATQNNNQNTNTTTKTTTNTTTNNPTVVQPTATSNNSGSSYRPSPTPTITPAQNTQIVEDIDNTQATIEETIEEMENIAQDDATPVPTNTPAPPTNTPVPTATPQPATPEPQNIIAPTAEPTEEKQRKDNNGNNDNNSNDNHQSSND